MLKVPEILELPPDFKITDEIGVGCVIDTETTGFDPYDHEMIEIALVMFAFNRESYEVLGIIAEYTGLREPDRSIPREATRVHGLRKSDVKGMKFDDEAINSMLAHSEFLVAHNASFDKGFVSQQYRVARDIPWFCSMNGIPWRQMGFQSKGLQQLLANHGIAPGRAHRALDDARGCLCLLAATDEDGDTRLYKLIRGDFTDSVAMDIKRRLISMEVPVQRPLDPKPVSASKPKLEVAVSVERSTSDHLPKTSPSAEKTSKQSKIKPEPNLAVGCLAVYCVALLFVTLISIKLAQGMMGLLAAVLVIVGLVSLIYPLHSLGIKSRKTGAILLAIGILVSAFAQTLGP